MTVGRRGSCPNPNIPLAGRQLRRLAAYFIDFTAQGYNENGQMLYARNPGGTPANVAVAAGNFVDVNKEKVEFSQILM